MALCEMVNRLERARGFELALPWSEALVEAPPYGRTTIHGYSTRGETEPDFSLFVRPGIRNGSQWEASGSVLFSKHVASMVKGHLYHDEHHAKKAAERWLLRVLNGSADPSEISSCRLA